MTIAWIVGSRGVLGSALGRTLRRGGTGLFSPAERFRWNSETELAIQFATTAQAFAGHAWAAGRWEIYWAAGVGTMSSSHAALEPETRALSAFLRSLESDPRLMTTPGTLAFSSSAGAIYAGSPEYIISEHTSPAPTTAYAREKLKQEDLVRSFACANNRMSALLARLSTIYGPGHSAGKPQGLLAHVARCIAKNQPVHIYVPLDTMRDYVFSDDAAAAMIAASRAIGSSPRVLMKIIASEQPTTIADIVATFRRIARRSPRVITSVNRLSSIYPRCVRFRSTAGPEHPLRPRTSLLVGIAQVMAAERAAFVHSRDRGALGQGLAEQSRG